MSGGFAIVQPDSQLSINAVEGFPLEDFSADVRRRSQYSYPYRLIDNSQAIRSQITEAQKIAGGSGSEQDIAEARIELEVDDFRSVWIRHSLTNCIIGIRKSTSIVEVELAYVYTKIFKFNSVIEYDSILRYDAADIYCRRPFHFLHYELLLHKKY